MQLSRVSSIALPIGTLAVTGCSEEEQGTGGTAGAGGTAGTGGAAGTGGTGGNCLAVVDCPAEVPNEGAACAPGLLCYYRDSINIDNQTVARCEPNGWSVRVETGEGECPATQPVSGEACDRATVQTAACFYDPMVCYCHFGTNQFWDCYRPLEEGCPPQPPVAGTCCNVDFAWCIYEPCDMNHPAADIYECNDGIWSNDSHLDCAP